jgi:hypothetical protein
LLLRPLLLSVTEQAFCRKKASIGQTVVASGRGGDDVLSAYGFHRCPRSVVV